MNDLADRIAGEIPRLRRYARALLRSETEADDLVQECVLRGLAKQHLWQEGTDLRAWLFTILHNQFVNNVRRAAREGTSVEISDLDGDTSELPSQEKRLELRDLDRALSLLPDEQRTLIFLIGLEGMDYESAGKIVGVPVGTVRSRLSRARVALRQLMGIKSDSAAETKEAEAA
jgi:RNA polymerase sigma-70 factor (ECF subfamily)